MNLVVGASGLVGGYLMRGLERRSRPVSGTYSAHPQPNLRRLDVRDPQAVTALLDELCPTTIFLSGALTNVDACELHPDEADAINVVGMQRMIDWGLAHQAKIVFFSTDYIFDGSAGPYAEDAPPNPINVYGRHKQIVEAYLQANASESLIIRTTVVYGWEAQEKNFVCRLIRTLRARQTLSVPDDQIGSPTYAGNLADAVLSLCELGAVGIFNVAGRERLSRYEFARIAAEVFDLESSRIEPVKTTPSPTSAARPLKAGFVVEKLERALGRPMLDSREGLLCMKESLPA